MTQINRLTSTLEKRIKEHEFEGAPQNLYDPLNYILKLGGKRIRPLLTLLAYDLFKDDFEKVIPQAIAIEVFHNFTLMHDDIMDNAPIRRGQTTVHEKWDVNTAILSGDVMLIRAYDLLVSCDEALHSRIISRFNEVARQVCEGQQMDMNFETMDKVSKEEYIEMIRLKTAVLIGFALELGGILAGAKQEETKLLYQLGENLGLAFQIQDDLLDTFGNEATFGKQIGGDIIENKKTILWVEAMTSQDSAAISEIKRSYSLSNEKEKIASVKTQFEKMNIKATCSDLMESYKVACNQNLNGIKSVLFGKVKLRNLMNSLFERTM